MVEEEEGEKAESEKNFHYYDLRGASKLVWGWI
jgi:hypothetical protein